MIGPARPRHRALVATALILLLLAPTLPDAMGAPGPAEPQRVVVNLDTVRSPHLHDVLSRPAHDLVRVDPVLGFAVVETVDPVDLRGELPGAVAPDQPVQLHVDAVVAEAPPDMYYGAQWAPQVMNLPQAWNIEQGDVNVTVAVIDSGIHASHPDLRDARILYGHDYIDGDGTPQDTHGHGTAVAGPVVATRGNLGGIAGTAKVSLYVSRIIGDDGTGSCYDGASAIREAADAGADVISLSWSCPAFSTLHDAVQYATGQGSLVVAAAGNYQQSNPSACVSHPAAYPEVVAVGALDPTLEPAPYSCRGASLELTAPGSVVLTTSKGGGYRFVSGTSIAAPHVSAVAGLLKAHEPNLDEDAMRTRLDSTARDMGPNGWDPAYGYGMVDPVAALSGASVWAPGT